MTSNIQTLDSMLAYKCIFLGTNKDKQASFCLSLFDSFFFFKEKEIDLFAFVWFSNGTLNIAHKQFAWNLKLDTNNNLEKPKVVLLRSSKNNMQVVSSHDPILTNQKTILHHECNYIGIITLRSHCEQQNLKFFISSTSDHKDRKRNKWNSQTHQVLSHRKSRLFFSWETRGFISRTYCTTYFSDYIHTRTIGKFGDFQIWY